MALLLSPFDKNLHRRLKVLAAKQEVGMRFMIEKILFCFLDTKSEEEMNIRLKKVLEIEIKA